MMYLSQIATAVSGQMHGDEVMLSGVSIDSRQSCENSLFVALDGERFDAHEFISQAEQNGAAAVLIEKPVATTLPTVQVADTFVALKQVASWWRAQFVLPVIGVTGSVGKTSVKEMLGAIFSEIGKGLVTHGNLNNEIGVPLTLMRLVEDDLFAIIEMGMNHAGEISRLTQIARPTVALINNAAAAHLEGLGTVAAVAAAKGEIFEGLSEDGVAVINNDDDYAEFWHQLAAPHKVVTFGLKNADVTADYQLHTDHVDLTVHVNGAASSESLKISLNLVGRHNVMNALAAIAVAYAANIPLEAVANGLANYKPISGRLNITRIGDLTVIDDTYNANPASMRAAIDVLAQFTDTTLILGDMGELGDAADQEHLQLGAVAQDRGIDRVFACGEYAAKSIKNFSGTAISFTDQARLLNYLADHPVSSGTVLVKGSRSAKMENVVELIKTKYGKSIAETEPTEGVA
ncbi:MAG: UDP-N-acetylmuramoyl-tripeptide--D-alanyl-D-alanine ligase [Pseudomonadota bacterium]